MLFYFTATGNSLYVAKHLDEELVSIPQEMNKQNRHYQAKRIGIVCPLFEFEMPDLVKEFISTSTFDTEYFYIIISYGMHHGGVALRTKAFLDSIHQKVDYINTIIMHDNAIIVFDMDEQRKIEHTKHVDEHIAILKQDVDAHKQFIQDTNQEETDFYNFYQNILETKGPQYSFPLYTIKDTCKGCGICTQVCPRGCIQMKNGHPEFDYTNCLHCTACAQHCSAKAIVLASGKEPNPNARYRHPKIALTEIIHSNKQN